jgi:predicted Rossmann fold nucleotide-binding protein DprA/Smf involved in DNA uptake
VGEQTKGGRWCEADIHKLKMSDLFSREAAITAKLEKEKQASSSMTEQPGLFVASESRSDKKAIKTETTSSQNTQDKTLTLSEKNSNTQELASKSSVDFYRLFITELDRLATIPVTFDALVKNTGLHKAQLNDWLKRATNDGVIKKLNRPVRYQVENKK